MILMSRFNQKAISRLIISVLILSLVLTLDQNAPNDHSYIKAESNKDPYHHFYQIFNSILSMYQLIYNIVQLALDIFLIPFHLALFFHDLGLFNFLVTNVLNTSFKLFTSIIPNGVYFSFSFILGLIEFLFYFITNLLSALYVLAYLSFNVINYVIYGIDYLYINFSGKSKSLFFNDEPNDTSFYTFIINLFNPKYVWNNFGLLSIIVFSLEFQFICLIFSIIKKFKVPVNYIIIRFCKRRVRTDLFNQYCGNYEKILDSEAFRKEKISQEACFICLDDFSADVEYEVVDYPKIKNKVNELLINESWNLKNRLREKFDNYTKLIKLSCSHFYHGSCIGDYIHFNKEARNSTKCPSCRSIL